MPAIQLLADFPPVSTEAWEAAIAADLKGASYEDKLIWHAPEGVAVRPYYRAEDLAGLDWTSASLGDFPFARGSHAEPGWRIREEIAAADPAEANRRAQAAVAAGAEEIAFRGVALATASDLALLLSNLAEIPVYFTATDPQRAGLLIDYLKAHPRAASTSASVDPMADLEFSAGLMQFAAGHCILFTLETGRAAPPDVNATAAAGWALAAGVDFLATFDEHGIDIDRAVASIEFAFEIGTNYFYEIARLRAFRMLWARVVESIGGSPQNAQARIAARTVNRAAATEASHWNMLRATTEAMSAILGGADSICVTPFDDSEPARRLARNTQLLLRHEAFFARVADPGGGSYYLEHLTADIAAQAWHTVQAIEARGGWRRATA